MKRLLKSFDTKEKAIQYLSGLDRTGAHHWLIAGRQMTCKYCNMVRKLDEKGLVIANDN